MQTEGLHLEQAPPLAVPAAFFLTAPLALLAGGALLTWLGSLVLTTHWAPATLALTHLGTLGFVTMVMLGALYQVTAVIAGSPVPRIRLAHAVHAMLVLGLIGLVFGLIEGRPRLLFYSLWPLTLALLLFLIPLARALRRAPTRNASVTGMRLALSSLFLVGFLGVWMAHGHSGMSFPNPLARGLWIQVHLSIGLLGWVGTLISAVSWQVVPMFYLCPAPGSASQRATLGLVALSLILLFALLCLDYAGLTTPGSPVPSRLAGLAALPAAAAVWGLQPAVVLRSLANRRRRRADGSLLFWVTGAAIAPLTGITAAASLLLNLPYTPLLLVWLAVWGWAGMIIHGMLTRIVPFLVWFHRFSPLVGRVPVPSVRRLLPDGWVRLGFALHAATLVAGAVAIASRETWIARLTGLLLMATALQLGRSLLHVLRQRAEPDGS